MTAQGWAQDDKVSRGGDFMTGTLAFQGSPPYTLVNGAFIGTVTLNGTSAVTVSASGITASSMVFLTVQPTTAPVGIPYVASKTAGTGFTVKSTSGSDTAVLVAWQIVNYA